MKPKSAKPQTHAQALDFLQEIAAIQQQKKDFRYQTPKGALSFILYPGAIKQGSPVADGFAQLAAQQYAEANSLSLVIRFTGLEVEALVGPPVGAIVPGGVRYAPPEKAVTPGLALCRALWSYLNNL